MTGARSGVVSISMRVSRGKTTSRPELQEIVVEGERGGVVTDARGNVAVSRGNADDAADESESVGGDTGLGGEVAIFIEGAASQHGQQQGRNNAGLVTRRDGAFGIEREILSFLGGGTGERAFHFAVDNPRGTGPAGR